MSEDTRFIFIATFAKNPSGSVITSFTGMTEPMPTDKPAKLDGGLIRRKVKPSARIALRRANES